MAANKGSKHHGAKMTEATVKAARASYQNREGRWVVIDGKRRPITMYSLAEKYGVAHQTMHAVLSRKTWRHIA